MNIWREPQWTPKPEYPLTPQEDFEEADFPEEEPDDSSTIRCRNCAREIYEDAFQCPYCGEYVEWDTNPWSGRPAWWVVLAFLGIAALVAALILGI